jgi:predicted metal-binding membrane protein
VILQRSDGTHLYHLPLVVDDVDQRIDTVIRGADHFLNTCIHLAIYAALDAAQKSADSQMTAKQYKEAKAGYEKVKTLADDAAKAAASGKAALKAEVEKAVGELETKWTALQTTAQASAKKLKPEMKKAWDEGSAKVTDAIKAIKAAAASEPAAAKEKLAEVGAAIEKWTADLAAAAMPAAAPGKPAATTPQVKKK